MIQKLANRVDSEDKWPNQQYNHGEVQEFMRYLDYMLGVMSGLPESHFARVSFSERFKSLTDITSQLQEQKYSTLLVKSVQYSTDLLIKIAKEESAYRKSDQTGLLNNEKHTNSPISLRNGNNLTSPNQKLRDLSSSKTFEDYLNTQADGSELQKGNKGDESDASRYYHQRSKLSTLTETPKKYREITQGFLSSNYV